MFSLIDHAQDSTSKAITISVATRLTQPKSIEHLVCGSVFREERTQVHKEWSTYDPLGWGSKINKANLTAGLVATIQVRRQGQR